jgi:hypothetical protein
MRCGITSPNAILRRETLHLNHLGPAEDVSRTGQNTIDHYYCCFTGYLGELMSKPSEYRRKKGLRKLFESDKNVTEDDNTK